MTRLLSLLTCMSTPLPVQPRQELFSVIVNKIGKLESLGFFGSERAISVIVAIELDVTSRHN